MLCNCSQNKRQSGQNKQIYHVRESCQLIEVNIYLLGWGDVRLLLKYAEAVFVFVVKYLGLLAMSKILKTHPKSVQSHKDLILQCLDDKDESIRLRALDLLYGMVWSKYMCFYINIYQLLTQILSAR